MPLTLPTPITEARATSRLRLPARLAERAAETVDKLAEQLVEQAKQDRDAVRATYRGALPVPVLPGVPHLAGGGTVDVNAASYSALQQAMGMGATPTYETLAGTPTTAIRPPAMPATAPSYYETQAAAHGTDPSAERFAFLSGQLAKGTPLSAMSADAQAFMQSYGGAVAQRDTARAQAEAARYATAQGPLLSPAFTGPDRAQYDQLMRAAAINTALAERSAEAASRVADVFPQAAGDVVQSATGQYRPAANLREVAAARGLDRSPNLTPERVATAAALVAGGLVAPELLALRAPIVGSLGGQVAAAGASRVASEALPDATPSLVRRAVEYSPYFLAGAGSAVGKAASLAGTLAGGEAIEQVGGPRLVGELGGGIAGPTVVGTARRILANPKAVAALAARVGRTPTAVKASLERTAARETAPATMPDVPRTAPNAPAVPRRAASVAASTVPEVRPPSDPLDAINRFAELTDTHLRDFATASGANLTGARTRSYVRDRIRNLIAEGTVSRGTGEEAVATREEIVLAAERALTRRTAPPIEITAEELADNPGVVFDRVVDIVSKSRTLGGRRLFNNVKPERIREALADIDPARFEVFASPGGRTRVRLRDGRAFERAVIEEAATNPDVQRAAAETAQAARTAATENDRLRAVVESGGTGGPRRPRTGSVPSGAGASQPDLFTGSVHVTAPLHQQALELINLPRSVLSAFDFSYPLRQGGPLAISHNKEWRQAFRAGLEVFRDYDAAYKEMARIRSGSAGRSSRLAITPLSTEAGSLNAREEAFVSKWVGHIPGLRRSADASIVFINKLRADTYDAVVKSWVDSGNMPTAKELDALAGYLNAATGRGNLGQFESAALTLSQAFFSPRFLVARIQAPLYMFHASSRVRNEALKDFSTYIGSRAALLGIAATAADDLGISVQVDPRHTDFGQLRIGNTRIDTWGGYTAIPRLMARLASGEAISAADVKRDVELTDEVWGFVRGRFSPQTAALFEIASGRFYDGERMTTAPDSILKQFQERFVPLFVQDMAEAISDGNALGIALASGSFLGLGANTYAPSALETESAALIRQLMADPGRAPELAAFGSQLEGANWFDLTGKERDALQRYAERTGNTNLAQAVADNEDSLRWHGSVFQKARDQVDAYWTEQSPRLDALLSGLRTRSAKPEDVIDAIRRMRTEAGAAYASPEYRDAIEALDSNNIQKLLDAYNGLYDRPDFQKGGVPDYEKIEAGQAKLIEVTRQSDPALAARLEYNVARGADPSDHVLLRLYDQSMAALSKGYWQLAPGETKAAAKARETYREQHPREDALFVLWGYASKFRSQAALEVWYKLATGQDLQQRLASGAFTDEQLKKLGSMIAR